MKIGVLGSGGREHAIGWKLGLSNKVDKVFYLPGNGGTENNIPLDIMNFDSVGKACLEEGIELLIVGPEAPLAAGIIDYFKSSDLKVFGPDKKASQLESSKIFAKRFMKKYNVSTAKCWILDAETENRIESLSKIRDLTKGNCVIKYDGLAAGKGVFVCSTPDDFEIAVNTLLGRYGKQAPILIEEKLVGDELSILAFTDGKHYKLLLPSQDHKQLLAADKGPNTGGMGAFCPVPGYSEKLDFKIRKNIIEPTIAGINSEELDYHGVLYFGLMITEKGPQVLEYNIRLGDPETEVVLPALKSDLLSLILACWDGNLNKVKTEFESGYFVDVVLVSGGYPGEYAKNYNINGWDKQDLVFCAGVSRKQNKLCTSGGRVLNVVAHAQDLDKAISKAYEKVTLFDFKDLYYRPDIGKRTNTIIKSYVG